jgi:catechol 2,3-dioxygenase-like lactoylglutathione lyase family enzyme
MDVRLELVMVPVSDADRAIAFYVDRAGFVLDHDIRVDETVRFIQVTPPGSACSIMLDSFSGAMAPGSQRGLQAVVDDADASRADLKSRGVEVSEVDDQPWGRFVHFADPDGNTWALQQLPPWAPALAAQG